MYASKKFKQFNKALIPFEVVFYAKTVWTFQNFRREKKVKYPKAPVIPLRKGKTIFVIYRDDK